jgi:hypothetical protein
MIKTVILKLHAVISGAGMAQSVQRRAVGQTARAGDFSLFHSIHTSSGANTASHPFGEDDHTSIYCRGQEWSFTSTTPYVFTRVVLK